MTDDDRNFHDSFKTAWGPQETMLYPADSSTENKVPTMMTEVDVIKSDVRDVHVSKFARSRDVRSHLSI